jgi:hypothetical protein
MALLVFTVRHVAVNGQHGSVSRNHLCRSNIDSPFSVTSRLGHENVPRAGCPKRNKSTLGNLVRICAGVLIIRHGCILRVLWQRRKTAWQIGPCLRSLPLIALSRRPSSSMTIPEEPDRIAVIVPDTCPCVTSR